MQRPIFRAKNTSPKWRSRRWLEIAQKLFHQRVGDKILRQKFGIHLSSISNNKGTTAPRKLLNGLFSKQNYFWTCTFFDKFCFFPISRLSSTYQNPDCVKTSHLISLKFCRRVRIKNRRRRSTFFFGSHRPFWIYLGFYEKIWTLIAPPFWIGLLRNLVW